MWTFNTEVGSIVLHSLGIWKMLTFFFLLVCFHLYILCKYEKKIKLHITCSTKCQQEQIYLQIYLSTTIMSTIYFIYIFLSITSVSTTFISIYINVKIIEKIYENGRWNIENKKLQYILSNLFNFIFLNSIKKWIKKQRVNWQQ